MPFSEQQSTFVTKYVSRRAAMKKIREDRDTTGDIPVGAATPKEGLEEKLADTGRVLDTRLPEGDRDTASEERREAHLRDILLRDEDGLNANQIVMELAPVTEQEFKDARREPRDATDALVVNAAKAKVAKQRAMQRYVADEIISRRDAEMTTNSRSKRMATNMAIAELAAVAGQRSLSHHASRHGPATTIEQHITRIATGFAPDDPLPSTLTSTDVLSITTRSDTSGGVTGDPVTADVPKVRSAGPNYATGASRTGSGEAGLYMIEDALAKIHESSTYTQAASGDKFVVRTLARSGDVSVGEGAKLEKNAGQQALSAPAAGTGAQTTLPGRNPFLNTLNGTNPAAKDAAIKERAEAILIQRDIKQSRVVVLTLPDGTFRTITAFPDSDVTADSFEKNSTAANLTTERTTAMAAALSAAQTAATNARDASDNAIATRSAELGTKTSEYETARDELHDLFRHAAPGGTALLRLAVATHERAIERAELESITDSIAKVQTHRDNADRAVTDTTALLTGLTSDLATKKAAYDSATDDATKQTTVEAYQKAAEALAQAKNKIEAQTKVRDTCDAHLSALRAEVGPQTTKYKTADAEFNRVYGEACDATDEDTANKTVQAEQTRDAKLTEMAKIQKELKVLADKANLAESLLQEIKDQQSLATVPTDTQVDAERAERETALRTALTTSHEALDTAQAQWSAEIDGVAAMFEDDAELRAESLERLKSRRMAAADKVNALTRELDALRNAATQVDPSDHAAVADAASAVTAKEAQVTAARATNAKLKSQFKNAQLDDKRQKKLDDANISLARSVLATSVARIKAEKAEADDSPDKTALRAAATKAEAKEAMNKAERDRLNALIESRAARNRLRLARLSAARTDASLTQMRADLSAAPTPLSDEMVTLRDVTIPRFETVKADADSHAATAEAASVTAEATFNRLHTEFEAAKRAYAAL